MKNKSLISISNLTHSFEKNDTKHTVLHDVSLDFYSGETVIVMGPSGAGKTTLLTLLGALRTPQAGSIVVQGIELRNATTRQQLEVRQRIGFIFQAHNLLESLTAFENVQMGLAHLCLPHTESQDRARTMLQRVGLEMHMHKRPRHLSVGQRQRVAIARGLVRAPLIIIADEPTASLDSHTGREIVELLYSLSQQDGCAVLMVTHDTRILDLADRILTLEDGRIDESNQIIDRIRSGLFLIMEQISQYPALFAMEKNKEQMDALMQKTRKSLGKARIDISTFVPRKMNESLTKKTTLLHSAVENIFQIENAITRFCEQISEPPSASSAARTDAIFQSLEFLLFATAEMLGSNSEDDIKQLLKLTSDKNDLMEELRKKYINAEQTATAKEQSFVFDLTQSFAIAVHFLHSLAENWAIE